MLAGEKLALRATAPGAQPGSTVVITWTVNGRRARSNRQPLADGGTAFDSLRVDVPGTVRVRATLRAPDASDAGSAPTLVATSLLPYVARGHSGLNVRFLQSKLGALGYSVPVTGAHDVRSQFAVIAYNKVNGRARTSTATRSAFTALARGRGAYRTRFPGQGRHVEFDRNRQVLALIESGGRVFRVYHSSSGRPRFRTPLGNFRFWRKEPGLNSRQMLHTVYFTRDKTTPPTRPACGIHGYFSVPTYPYSHCCLRVGLWDALYIHRWVRLGERVHIYV
jgi:L,D-transpeptidase catalytic domain